MSWQEQRTMRGREFKTVIKELGMTQAGAGRYLDISERTARRVVLNQSVLSAPAVLLLRSLAAHSEKPVVPKWSKKDY